MAELAGVLGTALGVRPCGIRGAWNGYLHGPDRDLPPSGPPAPLYPPTPQSPLSLHRSISPHPCLFLPLLRAEQRPEVVSASEERRA